MFSKILWISVCVLLLAAIIYFIVRGFKSRTSENMWPRKLLIPLVVAIVVIPTSIYEIVHTTIVVATPVPNIVIPSNEIKITGRNTKGILKGKTTPNTLVTLKEDVDKDEDPIVKKAYSNSKGNFTFNKLEDSMSYKLSAKNKYHKSKVLKVTVSDIPDSAYTKLKFENSDEFGDVTVKQDSNNQATISGTSSKNARIRVENDNYDTIKTIHADKDGKWNLTLDGPHDKKEKDYTIYAKIPGLLETLGNDVTVKNPNYVKPVKTPKKKTTTTDNSSDTSNSDTSTTDTKTSDQDTTQSTDTTPKQSKKQKHVEGFKLDMTTYLGNKYPEMAFVYDETSDTVDLLVPDEVAYLGKNTMKAYFRPIYDRLETFAGANDMDYIPSMVAKTQDGSVVARTSVFGNLKVYADK